VTDNNVYYIKSDVIFDEAHMSEPASKVPLTAQTLKRLGYSTQEHYDNEYWIAKYFNQTY
jgi:hypothetical protein